MVNLSRIDLATDEDKHYGIDHWASLFKAGTWEELKAMAKENIAYEEAARTMFRLSSDEHVREQCRRRGEYYQQIRTYERDLAVKDAKIAEQSALLADKDSQLADKDSQLAGKDSQLADKDSQLTDKDAMIADRDAKIADMEAQITALKAQLGKKNV